MEVQITFDCAEPRTVAKFWQAALGYADPPAPEGYPTWDEFDAAQPEERRGAAWVAQDPEGSGPRLYFQRVPEPKTVKNRLHLDIRAGAGLTGAKRLAALEAEPADSKRSAPAGYD